MVACECVCILNDGLVNIDHRIHLVRVHTVGNQLPLFEPTTDWRVPERLPVVPDNVVLAVDTETRDDGLSQNRGPGWVFNAGYICGVSVAWGSEAYYIPVRHPDTANLPAEDVFPWIDDAMKRAKRIVFHNESYDRGWFSTENVFIPEGKTDDTYVMAVMCDENRHSYSLDACCSWRGVPGKDERLLREAAAAFGVNAKSEMWKLPARHVGPYATQDAVATLRLRQNLVREIEAQRLEEAYRVEMDLIPMVLEMRKRGIRVNTSTAERIQEDLRNQRAGVIEEIRKHLRWSRLSIEDLNSPVSLARAFDQEGIPYPKTPKTRKGSFKSDWMSKSSDWLPNAVVLARQYHDMAEKFLGTYILGSVERGRIHAEVHQLRDDNGGTRSFRFSYSNPPLQQIPARGETGVLIRSVFEAERGQLWLSADYSQQEPRLAVHFASLCRLQGAQQAVEYYANTPDADFHTMVSELTGVPRKRAKIINLGLMYGMGLAKLAESIGIGEDEAREMLAVYHSRMPFVKSLTEFCAQRANTRGWIRLLDGARSHFDDWEGTHNRGMNYNTPRRLDAAREAWPGQNLRRAFTHKAMNRLIQGSAARQTKLAMRACWKEGIVPLIQMHDELGCSVGSQREGDRICELMRDIVSLNVPMKVDGAYGHTWGQASQEAPKGIAQPQFEEMIKAGVSETIEEVIARRAA